jgi:putative lipase involved disintegration of autophagic bodies
MSEPLEFNLEYTDDSGDDKIIPVVVRNLFHFYYRDYKEIENVIIKVQSLQDEILSLHSDYGTIKNDPKSEKREKEVSEIVDKINAKKEEIESMQDAVDIDLITDKRINLIMKLLSKNGYAKHKLLSDRDFWIDSVKVHSMNDLMLLSYYKDVDKKKILKPTDPFSV